MGKSCILSRFVKDKFSLRTTTTIGVDIETKFMNIDSKVIKVQVWDTGLYIHAHGPFADTFPGVMISPFGVIPKSGQLVKWHLIVDLSAPLSASVTDGISSVDSKMAYSSVTDAARPKMAKMELQVPIGLSLFIQTIATFRV